MICLLGLSSQTVFNQSMTEQKHNNTGCVYNAQLVIIYEVIQQQKVKITGSTVDPPPYIHILIA